MRLKWQANIDWYAKNTRARLSAVIHMVCQFASSDVPSENWNFHFSSKGKHDDRQHQIETVLSLKAFQLYITRTRVDKSGANLN